MARFGHMTTTLLAASLWAGAGVSNAQAEGRAQRYDGPLSPEMRTIDVSEQKGEVIDPALRFVDHTGKEVALGRFFDGERPVLLTLNYYRCGVICSVQLQGLADALSELDWTPGDDNFRVVTVSIDPREGPEDSKKRRDTLLATIGKGDDVDWTFMTGDALSIKVLAAQLGIGYSYDAEQDQYAHPASAVFLSPEGKIVQYVYGLTYVSQDLKFGLLDAGEGKIGSPMEKIILSCFHYDATIGRYGPWAFGIMRLGGLLTMLILGSFLAIYWVRDRRGRQVEAAT